MTKVKIFFGVILTLILSWPISPAEAVSSSFSADTEERSSLGLNRNDFRIFKEYFPSGVVRLEGKMKGEKRQGLFSGYFEDGRLRWRGYYVDDNEQGVFRHYNLDGTMVFEAEYKNGMLDGWVRAYSQRGRLIREIYYRPTKSQGPVQFASLKPQVPLDNLYSAPEHAPLHSPNPFYGLWKDYYQNGSLKAVRFYKDNLLEGVAEEYYDNGQLKSMGLYRHGNLISLRHYDRDGREIDEDKIAVE